MPAKPTSCYDCTHCKLIAPSGHTCMAPVPAWTQSERNGTVPVIEDADHDATMARDCALFNMKDPSVGDTLCVHYSSKWIETRIIRDEDAIWRVEYLQGGVMQELTVWKANSSSWRRL